MLGRLRRVCDLYTHHELVIRHEVVRNAEPDLSNGAPSEAFVDLGSSIRKLRLEGVGYFFRTDQLPFFPKS